MLSIVLFISGGEIFLIFVFILIFFGADKIPEFMRVMNRGMRDFKKASDDIKREFSENTSGMMKEFRTIQNDLSESLTKEIAEPVQKTLNETEKTFGEYKDQVEQTVNDAGKTFEEYQDPVDYYYQNPGDSGYGGKEYANDASSSGNTGEGAVATSGAHTDAGTAELVADAPQKSEVLTAQANSQTDSSTEKGAKRERRRPPRTKT